MPDRVEVPGPTSIEAGPFLFKAKFLSPRQRDVLHLAARGYCEAEIAQTLVLSVYTVKNYLRSARATLGARNTANAVAIALSRRLISFDAVMPFGTSEGMR